MRRKCMFAAVIFFVAMPEICVAIPPRLVNPGAWFFKREAPADSLKRGERAMTALDLTIASDGSVKDCAIAYSSRSVMLDQYACTLFKQNARYEPSVGNGDTLRKRQEFLIWEASKEATNAKTSKASPAMRGANSTMWVTTDDLPNGALGKDEVVVSNVALSISAKGDVTACSATLPSERPDLDERVCALMFARAHYKPARNDEGTPMEGIDWATIRWQVPRDRP